MRRLAVDVCVVGGGPAGAALGQRLARLGHRVAIIERSRHRGPPRGESLDPGAWDVLEQLGFSDDVLGCGAWPVRRTLVRWAGDGVDVRDHRPPSLAVERPRLDAALLARAGASGAIVLQPATARGAERVEDGWRVAVDVDATPLEIHAALLADASGRSAWRRGGRVYTGLATFALHAVWHGAVPGEARVEALPDGWLWGAPLGPRRYAAILVTEAARGLDAGRYLAALSGAALFGELPRRAACEDPPRCRTAATRTADACEAALYRVGDAGRCLDPLSSAGIRGAVGSAIHAAAAIHTTLLHPERAELARRFFEDAERARSERHHRWTGAQYAASPWAQHDFWLRRATSDPSPPTPRPIRDVSAMQVALAGDISLEEMPCLDGDLIVVRRAVRGNTRERSFVWLGGVEVAPLLEPLLAQPLTPAELMHAWRDVPVMRQRALLASLLRAGILEPVPG